MPERLTVHIYKLSDDTSGISGLQKKKNVTALDVTYRQIGGEKVNRIWAQ